MEHRITTENQELNLYVNSMQDKSESRYQEISALSDRTLQQENKPKIFGSTVSTLAQDTFLKTKQKFIADVITNKKFVKIQKENKFKSYIKPRNPQIKPSNTARSNQENAKSLVFPTEIHFTETEGSKPNFSSTVQNLKKSSKAKHFNHQPKFQIDMFSQTKRMEQGFSQKKPAKAQEDDLSECSFLDVDERKVANLISLGYVDKKNPAHSKSKTSLERKANPFEDLNKKFQYDYNVNENKVDPFFLFNLSLPRLVQDSFTNFRTNRGLAKIGELGRQSFNSTKNHPVNKESRLKRTATKGFKSKSKEEFQAEKEFWERKQQNLNSKLAKMKEGEFKTRSLSPEKQKMLVSLKSKADKDKLQSEHFFYLNPFHKDKLNSRDNHLGKMKKLTEINYKLSKNYFNQHHKKLLDKLMLSKIRSDEGEPVEVRSKKKMKIGKQVLEPAYIKRKYDFTRVYNHPHPGRTVKHRKEEEGLDRQSFRRELAKNSLNNKGPKFSSLNGKKTRFVSKQMKKIIQNNFDSKEIEDIKAKNRITEDI